MNVEILGFAAGILTSINLIPQIIKSIKTKKVDELSLASYVIYDLGLLLWVVYGFFIRSYAIMVMDGFAFICSLFMTYLKMKYDE